MVGDSKKSVRAYHKLWRGAHRYGTLGKNNTQEVALQHLINAEFVSFDTFFIDNLAAHIMASKRSSISQPPALLSTSTSTSKPQTLRASPNPPPVLQDIETQLLPPTNGIRNAHNPETIDFTALHRVLDHVRSHGQLPPGFRTHDLESDIAISARALASPNLVKELQDVVKRHLIRSKIPPQIGLIEGSLLYHEPTIRDELDIRLFLRASKATAKRRRQVNMKSLIIHKDGKDDDYWRSPEYFDKVVWPSYSQEYAFLFNSTQNQGLIDEMRSAELIGVKLMSELNADMEDIVKWAVDVIVMDLRGGRDRDGRTDVPRRSDRSLYESDDHNPSPFAGIIESIRRAIYDIL
ncbi:MAG: ribosylnicotinamide kinase [Pycnora praestabilis]|nr:MAG: ribosylnicotinamide kinase [Pycnora praestabilis]